MRVALAFVAAVAGFALKKPTKAQCDCMGINKITVGTGRELTDNKKLNEKLLQCDSKKNACDACCSGDKWASVEAGEKSSLEASGNCKHNLGEEACSQACEASHVECESAAQQWAGKGLMQVAAGVEQKDDDECNCVLHKLKVLGHI
mmetsp:Transcript_12683/g.30333  ORF Transcript_12683/g.30333 Transcript_12683/m.30333 type:complete len:147 (-) Transcript_12683:37-477(-)